MIPGEITMKTAIKNILTPPESGQTGIGYTAPLVIHLLWIVSLFLTIFTIPVSLFSNGYVIFSIAIRILLIYIGVRGFKRFYLDKDADRRFYELWKHYTGYAIVITYVFTLFPQVVRDFNRQTPEPEGFGFVVGVLITSLFPALLFLLLSNDKMRTSTGAYNQADLEDRISLKKDKKLQKQRRKEMKKERTFLQNLWYEWVEPILGAILWVLLINHLLFQLYQIPTESMVPTFLIKDRVIVTKTQYGPTIPLTDFRLPALSRPKSGQIVTFSSPDMDDPDSDLRYKNVFTRIFQPFIYIITFTKVDIDSDEDGQPLARRLVKRVVGEPEEKLCILNDQVYKKREDSSWTLMSELPGQDEYGQTNLFYNENPRMNYQRINPSVRAVTDRAVSLVESLSGKEIEILLEEEKTRFLSLVSSRGADSAAGSVDAFLSGYKRTNDELKSELTYYLKYMSYINTLEASSGEKDNLVELFSSALGTYPSISLYSALRDLSYFLEEETDNPGYLDDNITTAVFLNGDEDPYEDFMIRTNGLYKYYRLVVYNALLAFPVGDLESFINDTATAVLNSFPEVALPGLMELSSLDIYTDGIERPSAGGRIDYYNFFEVMQFPSYPEAEDEYLGNNDYFLMGDNRYNSLDARLGRSSRVVSLDSRDDGSFAKMVEVSWDGHVMTGKHIEGRVRAVLFPFTRIKFF